MIAVPGLLRRDCAHPPTAARLFLMDAGRPFGAKSSGAEGFLVLRPQNPSILIFKANSQNHLF